MTEPALKRYDDEIKVPKIALYGGAVIVVASLIAAGLGRYAGIGDERVAPAPVVERVSLGFAETETGRMTVSAVDSSTASASATTLIAYEPEEGGFVRGVLRSFRHLRGREGAAAAAPLDLLRGADGRLALLDPETGHRVELVGFGQDNSAAFAELLALASAQGAARQPAEEPAQ